MSTELEFQNILRQMEKTPQDPRWHPEGNVLVHTALLCRDLLWTTRHEMGPEIMIAAVFHDTGKVNATEVHPDGRVTSHGHEKESVKIAEKFLPVLFPDDDHALVLFLVANHMRFKFFDEMSDKKKHRLVEEAVSHDRRRGEMDGRAFQRLVVFCDWDNGLRQAERHSPEERADTLRGFRIFMRELQRREYLYVARQQRAQHADPISD